jgi:ketosteroid isomerase-like protein
MTTVLTSTLTTEDRESIRIMTEQRWTGAALARDWDKALAMCAPDIVYMPADYPVLRGHAALRAWLDQFPPILKFAQPLESIEGQGNLAITRNTFAVTIDDAGKHVENTGKVLCAWQKDTSAQ